MTRAFLSWASADTRIQPITELFRDWLTIVFEGKIEFFYSGDISIGANPVNSINHALETADLGFIFLSNLTARRPWVIFEYGGLLPLNKKERVFPLLFDIEPSRLEEICPPMKNVQAASLLNPKSILNLVEHIANKIELTEHDKIKAQRLSVENQHKLTSGILEICSKINFLPDYVHRSVFYNMHLNQSKNFRMPEIFSCFEKDLFLVGINHAYLINLNNGTERIDALITSLHNNSNRRFRLLISDLWDEKIQYTYNKILLGQGDREWNSLRKVLEKNGTKSEFDRYIRSFCKKHSINYLEIKKRLEIRSIDLIMDTFWFVDVALDQSKPVGDMMLLPMTTNGFGNERVAFYAGAKDNTDLLTHYYQVCNQGWNSPSARIWPI